MQGQHTPDHATHVDCVHHVVVLGCEAFDELVAVEVGQQVYNLLQQKDYLVVCWQLAFLHVSQVLHDLLDLAAQSSEGLHLLRNAALEGVERYFFDFP